MTYNFLTTEPLDLDTVTATLARCLGVPMQEVDVADEDTDQNLRNWNALVFCDKETVVGDVTTSLDIYAQKSVQPQPSERELASAFALAADTVVLFPAEGVRPSAYWLATEDGLVTRARLYEPDDEEPRFRIDRVEAPVTRLPLVTVARIPEVVRDLEIATPLAEAFETHVHRTHPRQAGTPGTPLWTACSCLGAWEKLVRQMEAVWEPFGWYPPDLYRWRLEARNNLEQVQSQLPDSTTALLHNALVTLDTLFTELTVDDTAGLLRDELAQFEGPPCARGWWWNRRPEPLPW